MTRTIALIPLAAILLICLPPTVARTGGGRQLTLQARDVCRTVAALRLVVLDGTCQGSSTANCDVVLDRMGKIGEEFKDWWSGGVCDDERADVAAENISDVLANLWLETAVQVKCTGVGFACGWSAVEAPAWFDSVGDALDLVAAEAGAKEVKFCAPDMQSLTKDEEVDIESARKEVCATGGIEDGLKVVVKSTLTRALKSVFIRATSHPCSRDADSSCPAPPASGSVDVEGEAHFSASTAETIGVLEGDTVDSPEAGAEQSPAEASQTSEETPEQTPEEGRQASEETPEQTPEEGAQASEETSEQNQESVPEPTAGSIPYEPDSVEVTEEDALSAVDTVDILGNPDLDGLVIGPIDGIDQMVIGEQPSGTSETSKDKEVQTCECPTELCDEDAICRAVPLAQCKTVPKDGNCDECTAKFFVEDNEGSICASNSLAKCCGVCCRCDTFAQRFKAFGTLELGFCQEGSICNCLGLPDKYRPGG